MRLQVQKITKYFKCKFIKKQTLNRIRAPQEIEVLAVLDI